MSIMQHPMDLGLEEHDLGRSSIENASALRIVGLGEGTCNANLFRPLGMGQGTLSFSKITQTLFKL